MMTKSILGRADRFAADALGLYLLPGFHGVVALVARVRLAAALRAQRSSVSGSDRTGVGCSKDALSGL